MGITLTTNKKPPENSEGQGIKFTVDKKVETQKVLI
jgi:hypothetical protein